MPFLPAPSRWVALGFPGRFLSPIGPALLLWVSWKVVEAFIHHQALNPHTKLESRTLLVAIITMAMTTLSMNWSLLTKMSFVKIWTFLISPSSQEKIKH